MDYKRYLVIEKVFQSLRNFKETLIFKICVKIRDNVPGFNERFKQQCVVLNESVLWLPGQGWVLRPIQQVSNLIYTYSH